VKIYVPLVSLSYAFAYVSRLARGRLFPAPPLHLAAELLRNMLEILLLSTLGLVFQKNSAKLDNPHVT
jgi:hypothetical protein